VQTYKIKIVPFNRDYRAANLGESVIVIEPFTYFVSSGADAIFFNLEDAVVTMQEIVEYYARGMQFVTVGIVTAYTHEFVTSMSNSKPSISPPALFDYGGILIGRYSGGIIEDDEEQVVVH
jgi:hypothetical protein